MWKRRKAVRETESRRELSQMKTAVSWDGRAQRLRRKTTGVDSGISNNRKRLLHTDSDIRASGTLFERWVQPDTFSRLSALRYCIKRRIASTHQHDDTPWPCPKCHSIFVVTMPHRLLGSSPLQSRLRKRRHA
ncbi:hypothetical protein DPX16_22701 [Anabarilius grahami]|uniref:Uncharacterized protein n=1 Tax=Anabarilius grahami TaxID=495550 RepID=A0A3N0XXW3_ANAGA|nr:hypothetical protein DPX16_22701 [Anabarilius grahami]